MTRGLPPDSSFCARPKIPRVPATSPGLRCSASASNPGFHDPGCKTKSARPMAANQPGAQILSNGQARIAIMNCRYMACPLFSIVIPTYRRPGQVRNCLNAVVLIDYPRFEVIVGQRQRRTISSVSELGSRPRLARLSRPTRHALPLSILLCASQVANEGRWRGRMQGSVPNGAWAEIGPAKLSR